MLVRTVQTLTRSNVAKVRLHSSSSTVFKPKQKLFKRRVGVKSVSKFSQSDFTFKSVLRDSSIPVALNKYQSMYLDPFST